jgi:hypothetical protein
MIEAKPLAQLLQVEDMVVLANARPSTAIEAICPRSLVAAQAFQGDAGPPIEGSPALLSCHSARNAKVDIVLESGEIGYVRCTNA